MDYSARDYPAKTRSKNFQAGFALTHFLIIFPIIAVLMTFAASFTKILNVEKKIKSEVRPQIIELQVRALQGVSRLQKLNPMSKFLTLEKLQLQFELAIAVASENPIGVAVAVKKLADNNSRKKKLSALQKSIITTTEAGIHAKLLIISFQIKKTFRKHNSEIGGHDTASVSRHFGGLAIRRSSESEVAPEYFLKDRFELEQKVELQWNYPITAFLPKPIRKFSSKRFSDMSSSTPHKENQKWIAILKEDKFS